MPISEPIETNPFRPSRDPVPLPQARAVYCTLPYRSTLRTARVLLAVVPQRRYSSCLPRCLPVPRARLNGSDVVISTKRTGPCLKERPRMSRVSVADFQCAERG